jgi:transposase
MGANGGEATSVEELLKKALDEIIILKAENAQLRQENALLREALAIQKKNSRNSSKPPSSDIVKPPKEQRKKGKRKIGAQKGHEQHWRQPFQATQVDATVRLSLKACPGCGGELQIVEGEVKKHQQVELLEKPFLVTEYEQSRYWCAHCQCHHEAEVPLAVRRAGLFGPNLLALAAYLKGRCHMSYQTMQHFFAEAFGLKVSTGFLAKQVCKASKALKLPYDHLVEQLPKAKHLHSDETMGKENGRNRWIWCFRGQDFTVFHIDPLRSSVVLEKLLGKDYAGTISSDFHSMYKKFKGMSNARLQLCWAHLIREVKFLAEHADKEVSTYGKNLLQEIHKMFSTYHRRGRLKSGNYWLSMMRSCKEMILATALGRVPAHRMAQTLSSRFKDWPEEYFRFIDEDLPPTNNLCEQSIRPVVIDRKITQGTRSDWGNRWSERIWTVLATCKQREVNVLSFVRSCVGAFLQGYSPPLLLVE